ncbi:hypothetical protein SMI01S_01040 [Sphingobacterium mizutaii NBRC 14946 = DSM 11724]|uniref:Glycogen synthase n=2 Tax=Sphingobacterium mizutaii TaxID=1010 RepID=A0AAJ5C216_9SPHI|nr:glycosyltransferase family 4 protein [Sphingobacterium mizutaii]GEM66498.1 hypothetical protein SMI01S_01040 [Sphingobacterium mizutaii NBRC 14946 = DSM 11724]SDL52916.1 Glycosyltransferase involved in cell wall bisynthesis [Sphingobacterium mizutaii]SNV62749.1 Glycogen synthase [Sphingobacterium mizutaii]
MSKKKLLLVNNTIFYESESKLYLNKETGKFFVEISDLNFDVTVFQISQQKTLNDNFANFPITDTSLNIIDIKRKNNRFFSFLKAFLQIPIIVLKNDFIYLFYPGPICQFIALVCVLFRKKFGLYVRGEQGINSRFSKYLLKRAKFVMTISPLFTDEIKKINVRTNTIRPMIGFTELDIVKTKLIDNNKNLKILYVGRLVFDKGIFELISGFIKLINEGYELELILVGSGPDEEHIRNIIVDNKIEDKISLKGMISNKDDLKEIYNESDVFVLPSYHEGFPRVLYEALIMGVPIITTFVGSIPYLMKDSFNCVRIDPKSEESIVKKLKLIISNAKFRKQIAENGTKTIEKYLKDKKQSHAEQVVHLINKIDG